MEQHTFMDWRGHGKERIAMNKKFCLLSSVTHTLPKRARFAEMVFEATRPREYDAEGMNYGYLRDLPEFDWTISLSATTSCPLFHPKADCSPLYNIYLF